MLERAADIDGMILWGRGVVSFKVKSILYDPLATFFFLSFLWRETCTKAAAYPSPPPSQRELGHSEPHLETLRFFFLTLFPSI